MCCIMRVSAHGGFAGALRPPLKCSAPLRALGAPRAGPEAPGRLQLLGLRPPGPAMSLP